MKPLTVYTPEQLTGGQPPDLSSAAYRFLAEGDSWFTVSTLNPLANANLLFAMKFEQFACAVNCATPGDTLRRMAQIHRDPVFAELLAGRRAHVWDGLLLSCGGNDLIEALQAHGDGVPREQRLLLAEADWGPAADGPSRYFSREGWQTFRTYLEANFEYLVKLRDAGPSAGCPVFIHGYAQPTPRDSGAGLGVGPWLLPSLLAHRIPKADWGALSQFLMKELNTVLAAIGADGARFPNVHYFDSCAIALDAAALDTGGVSGDWVNEIHLTKRGCEKIAVPWAAAIEATLRA